MQKFKSSFLQITALVGLLFLTHAVWGFTEPAVAPPSGNVPAPVNVGSMAQTKLGRLTVNDLLTSNSLSTIGGAVLNSSGAANGLIIQNGKVGIGTAIPADSAILDITSTNKGFLLPRMSTTQRNNIASPSAGLIVFNTTTNKLNYFDGTDWQDFSFALSGVRRFSSSGSYSFTVPDGITNLFVTVVGGGGGGGGGANVRCDLESGDPISNGAGGGSGGAIVQYLLQTSPGTMYSVFVGKKGNGGSGGTGAGNDGGHGGDGEFSAFGSIKVTGGKGGGRGYGGYNPSQWDDGRGGRGGQPFGSDGFGGQCDATGIGVGGANGVSLFGALGVTTSPYGNGGKGGGASEGYSGGLAGYAGTDGYVELKW